MGKCLGLTLQHAENNFSVKKGWRSVPGRQTCSKKSETTEPASHERGTYRRTGDSIPHVSDFGYEDAKGNEKMQSCI